MEYPVLGQILGFVGINTDHIPEALPPQDEPLFIKDANNVIIKDGTIRKFPGTDFLNNLSSVLGRDGYRDILALPIYEKYSTDLNYLTAICPRDFYDFDGNQTWTKRGIGSPGTNASVATWANMEDKLIFLISEEGIVRYWNGTWMGTLAITAENVTTLKAKYLVEFKTHLILFNTNEDGTDYYSRIWPSNPGNIKVFSEEDKLDLDVDVPIVGAKKLGNDIFAYFNKGIQRVYWVDPDTGFVHDPWSSGYGLYAKRTLTGNEDIHFWLSQKGVMKMLYGGKPEAISNKKFNKLILDEIDPVYYHRATAKYYPHLDYLYIAYPSSGSSYPDTQIVYDNAVGELISKKKIEDDFYYCYGEWEIDLSNLPADERLDYGISIIPIIGSKYGKVYEQKINNYQDVDQDANVITYESSVTFPPTFWKDRSKNKRLLQSEWLIEKHTDEDISFTIQVTNEFNEESFYSYSITGNGNEGIRRYELITDDNGNNLDVFGKQFTVKIKDVNNPYGWELHGAIFRGYYTGTK